MAAKAFTYERIVEYLQNRGHALSGGGSSQIAYLALRLGAKHHLEITEFYNLIGDAPDDTLQVYYVLGRNGHKHYKWIGLPEWEGPSSEEQRAAQAEYDRQPEEDSWELQQRIWELEALNRIAEEDHQAALTLGQEAENAHAAMVVELAELKAANQELREQAATGSAAQIAELKELLQTAQNELDKLQLTLASRERELERARGHTQQAQSRADELGEEVRKLRTSTRGHNCSISGVRTVYTGSDGTRVLLDYRDCDGSQIVNVAHDRRTCTIAFTRPGSFDPRSDAERREAFLKEATGTIQ